jgi:hypothetical protein
MVWAPRINVAFETVIEIIGTPIIQLKQKRRGALAPRREKAKNVYLSSGDRRVNRDPFESNPRTPMHRKMSSDRSYRIVAGLYQNFDV